MAENMVAGSAPGHRDVHALAAERGHAAVVLCALLVRLPMHARGALVVDLHAVHAAIAFARIGIPREHQRQRDEAAAILRPAFQHRIIEQRKTRRADHLLARPFRHGLGKERFHFGQLRQHFELADQAFGHAHFQVFGDALGHGFHRIHLPSIRGEHARLPSREGPCNNAAWRFAKRCLISRVKALSNSWPNYSHKRTCLIF
jgi:hypothetical protein